MPKREPTLADIFIAAPRHKVLTGRSAKGLALIQDKVRRAEKMVFGDDASTRLGAVLRDMPELLVEQLQFARAPYELCWVEYQANTVWETMAGRDSDHSDMTRDKIVGALVDHNAVMPVSVCYNGMIGVFPFTYHLNTEWPVNDQVGFSDLMHISRGQIDDWLWGAVSNNWHRQGRSDYLRSLRNMLMVEYTGPIKELTAKAAHHLFLSSAGDCKNLVALLLMLNQPSITRYAQIPSTRGWIGNNPRRFAAHDQVHVALDAHQKLVKFVSEGGRGETRRLHRVRGHYCHDETARDYARIAGCIHEWIPTDKRWHPTPETPVDERMNWQCNICDGKRWWQSEHERGDAEKGYVRHDEYVVTP